MDKQQLKDYKKVNTCPVPNGILMLIGGAEKKVSLDNTHKEGKVDLSVLEKFVSLIETENPVIELVTTASSSDVEESYEIYKRSFSSIRPCTVNHIHHQNREDINEDVEARINNAHAVFFAGGDQLRLTSIYGGTHFMFLLKQRYIFENLIIAGTSAGAMALSTPMIFYGTGANEMIAGRVKITTGFEFLRDVCVDTHFVERGRFVRMAQVIATNPTNIGLGIEEDTAVIVHDGIKATVVGRGVIIVVDGKRCRDNNIAEFDEEKNITIKDLNVSILSDGDRFEIPQMNPPHL